MFYNPVHMKGIEKYTTFCTSTESLVHFDAIWEEAQSVFDASTFTLLGRLILE
jgi:hypothetical protein